MPLQFAGVGVQCDDGAAIEIVACAIVAIAVGTWISDAPVSQIEVGIIRARHPYGSASVLPCFVICRPRLVTGFAGTGNRIEPPGFFSGLCVVCGDEPTNPIFTARRAYRDFVFHSQWS